MLSYAKKKARVNVARSDPDFPEGQLYLDPLHPVLGNRDRWPAAGRGPEATGALPHARHVHPLHPHPQYHPGPGDSIMI